VTNTEYMNIFKRPPEQWVGREDKEDDTLAYAQIGMEHTEAMRRARLDGIWPYMYAGWTRTRLAARVRQMGKGSAVWKAGYAAPASAAWHSSLSPVLASLDLFDANRRVELAMAVFPAGILAASKLQNRQFVALRGPKHFGRNTRTRNGWCAQLEPFPARHRQNLVECQLVAFGQIAVINV